MILVPRSKFGYTYKCVSRYRHTVVVSSRVGRLFLGEITISRVFQPLYYIVQWLSIYKNLTYYYIADLLLSFTISRIVLYEYYYITYFYYYITGYRQPRLLSTEGAVHHTVDIIRKVHCPPHCHGRLSFISSSMHWLSSYDLLQIVSLANLNSGHNLVCW